MFKLSQFYLKKKKTDKAGKADSPYFLSTLLMVSVPGHGCVTLLSKVQAVGRNPGFSRSEGTRRRGSEAFNLHLSYY